MCGFDVSTEMRVIASHELDDFKRYFAAWVDVQELAMEAWHPKRLPGLYTTLRELKAWTRGVEKPKMHNAGNDAVATLGALIGLTSLQEVVTLGADYSLRHRIPRRLRRLRNPKRNRVPGSKKFWNGHPRPFENYPFLVKVVSTQGELLPPTIDSHEALCNLFGKYRPTAIGYSRHRRLGGWTGWVAVPTLQMLDRLLTDEHVVQGQTLELENKYDPNGIRQTEKTFLDSKLAMLKEKLAAKRELDDSEQNKRREKRLVIQVEMATLRSEVEEDMALGDLFSP